MKRVLTFEEGSLHCPTIYEGVLLQINRTQADQRPAATKRQEARVIRAIEKVSDPTEETFPGSKQKQRKANGSKIELSQDDVTFMKKLVEDFPWPSIDVVRAMDAADYLDTLEKVEE